MATSNQHPTVMHHRWCAFSAVQEYSGFLWHIQREKAVAAGATTIFSSPELKFGVSENGET
jgi:hypothetical protein